MEEENTGPFRRTSGRTRKVASRMVAALTSADNRTQAALARLEALENDTGGTDVVETNEDDDAFFDEDDEQGAPSVLHPWMVCVCKVAEVPALVQRLKVYTQKKQSKGTKRKTRQAKALENAKKAPRTFLELLQEANLEALPPHVPTYLRAAVGPPSSTSRRHFCSVCGYSATYTCVRCATRFCSRRCQNVHNDTRCLKFVA